MSGQTRWARPVIGSVRAIRPDHGRRSNERLPAVGGIQWAQLKVEWALLAGFLIEWVGLAEKRRGGP